MDEQETKSTEISDYARVVTCNYDDSIMLFYSFDVETSIRILAVAIVR